MTTYTPYNLLRRIDKLEERVGIKTTTRTEGMIQALREHGFEAVAAFFAESEVAGNLPFERIIDLMDDTEDPLVFERYRGLVPDDVIRKAYGLRVNHGGAEVRRRAGVIDDQGRPLPGYRMHDNGCIGVAPLAVAAPA